LRLEYATTGGVFAVALVLRIWRKLASLVRSIFRLIAQLTIGQAFMLLTLALGGVSGAFLWQDRSHKVPVIEPIAVPKALADSGYTPEVAGNRLHDALDVLQKLVDAEPESSIVDAANAANSTLARTTAERDELPDFVVPQLGLSVNAIVSIIRRITHYNDGGKVISGELIFRDKYALRLRVDGEEVFNSGYDSDNPDDLLDRAAPEIISRLWPANGAAVLYRTNPDQALRDAEDIIATFKPTDPNVWKAYRLRGVDFAEHDKFDEAEKMFRHAISLNANGWSLHNQLGLTLQRQRNFHGALAQFRQVVLINPQSAEGYVNIGAALFQIAKMTPEPDQAKLEEARASYEHAIALKPHDLEAHNNLGLLWNLEKRPDDAIREFLLVTKIDHNYLYGHWNLAADLAQQNKFDKALEQYRIALECTEAPRSLALIHVHIGDALKSKAGASGSLEEAVAEYRSAIEIDPFYVWPHNSLGEALRAQGKLDDAIAEFGAALHADDTDDDAIKAVKVNLEQAIAAREFVKENFKDSTKAREQSGQKEQTQPAPKQNMKEEAQAATVPH
jgi:tetratricopeptide (TPR) repeat protein